MTKKLGRPRREIDLALVEKLGEIQCTISEISAILDIPVGTLSKRPDFTEAHKKGLEGGKRSLRRYQFNLAQKNAAMAIWLGKQYLGQRDNIIQEVQHDFTAKQFFDKMAESTLPSYAIPAPNGSRKIQNSSRGKAQRKNGAGEALSGSDGDGGA